MRVGVYIDGFNLYHGGREHCGRNAPGWRWLDLRKLAAQALPGPWLAAGAAVERVVYCTARVSGATDPTSPRDQDVYLRALTASGSVDVIEYGNFVSRVRKSPLATENRRGGKPQIIAPAWPVKVKDAQDNYVAGGVIMVSHAHREEKGSDVNVGAHMLLDVLQGHMDAAMVFSNDSDLAFPVREARQRVPVGTVNPSTSPTAGKLKGTPADWCVHYMHAELGLPPRVIAEQMGWTLAGVLKLLAVYGHGDVGALEEVDKAFGANVTELRAVDSAASGMHGGPDAAS